MRPNWHSEPVTSKRLHMRRRFNTHTPTPSMPTQSYPHYPQVRAFTVYATAQANRLPAVSTHGNRTITCENDLHLCEFCNITFRRPSEIVHAVAGLLSNFSQWALALETLPSRFSNSPCNRVPYSKSVPSHIVGSSHNRPMAASPHMSRTIRKLHAFPPTNLLFKLRV